MKKEKKKNNLYKPLWKMSIIKITADFFGIPESLILATIFSQMVTMAMEGDVSYILNAGAWTLVLTLLGEMGKMISDIGVQRKKEKIQQEFRKQFLENLFQNPCDKLYQVKYGELIEHLNDDLDAYIARYADGWPAVIVNGLAIMGYMVFLSVKSPLCAFTMVGISFLQFVPPLLVKKYLQISFEECRVTEGEITEKVVEAINGHSVIQQLQLQEWWLEKMKTIHNRYMKIGRRADGAAAMQRFIYRLVGNILNYGNYAILGAYVLFGMCSMETAVWAIYISSYFFSAVKGFAETISVRAISQTAYERLKKWDCMEAGIGKTEEGEKSVLELKRVSYSVAGKKLLNEVSCRIYPEKNYVIRGKNGEGKTSLVQLICGLRVPDEGMVINHDLKLVYIPQVDPSFSFCSLELIEMFPNQTQMKIKNYLNHFEVSEEALGYSIADLSGGERKKLFLAIGFAMEPEILLLDEPTNHLDEKGKLVLGEMMRKRSGVLAVSHDEEMGQTGDVLYVLENGQLEMGRCG